MGGDGSGLEVPMERKERTHGRADCRARRSGARGGGCSVSAAGDAEGRERSLGAGAGVLRGDGFGEADYEFDSVEWVEIGTGFDIRSVVGDLEHLTESVGGLVVT